MAAALPRVVGMILRTDWQADPRALTAVVAAQLGHGVAAGWGLVPAQRIHFDTADRYWRDEGSGHLPVLRTAMLATPSVWTGTARSSPRRLLNVDDAWSEAVSRRLNELFPGHAATAGLPFVEHEYLGVPVAPLLAPSDIDAWNQGL
ncbi:hypothetical protein ACWHA1_28030 [Streptomyces decoyicus]